MKFKVFTYLSLVLVLFTLVSCTTFKPTLRTDVPGLKAEIPHDISGILNFTISPDGRYLLVIKLSGLYSLIDLKKGTQVLFGKFIPQTILNMDMGGGGAFSPDGQYFAVSGAKELSILSTQSKQKIKSIPIAKISNLSFSPKKNYILAINQGEIGFFQDTPGFIALLEVKSGQIAKYFTPTLPDTPSTNFFRKNFFSKDGKYFYTVANNSITLWDINQNRELKSVETTSSPFTFQADACLSPDNKYIVTGDTSGEITIKDPLSLTTLKKIKTDQSIWSVDVSPDNKYLLTAGKGELIIWDFPSLKEIKRIKHPAFAKTMRFVYAKFRPNSNQIISTSGDTVRIYDIDSGKELVSFVTFDDGEWIALTPKGYYNSSEKGDEYYHVEVQGKKYSLTQLREAFYRPDLVTLAISGSTLNQYQTMASINPPPKIEIIDTPSTTQSEKVDLKIKLTDQGGGIGDVRLYLNDTSILIDSARGIEITPKPGEKTVYKNYTVKLLSGQNTIKAVAFNADGSVVSNPAIHQIVFLAQKIRKPSMYAVVIGINEYKNPKLELKYAVADAKLFAETLKEVARPLFEKVNIKLLTTKEETTKENLVRTLQTLQTLNPDDVFVFYVASHGTVDDGEYFLITSNVGSLSTFRLKEDALTQTKLKELIANVPSTKKLIIIDTCNAGKLGEALQVAMLTRGMSEETAIKILSRAVGSTIISASTSLQEALEGYKGHGLFTYVLVEGMKGKADMDKDGFIKTLEIATYVDNQVPDLAEKVFNRPQYPVATPTGQAFPVGSVK